MSTFSDLIKKYDVPVPRYTSYPTVPAWQETPTEKQWVESLKATLKEDQSSWSMYIHLPFCESMCTFCGCNTIITKDHKKAHPYIEQVLKEWSLYLEKVPDFKTKLLRHIHLGGGSPTFLSADELSYLITEIFKNLTLAETHFEASIEIDPRRVNEEQLIALKKLGFNRVSLGVQDFNPEVQKIIHRDQPFELTQKTTQMARNLGYESVNFDLIYGLPLQTAERMISTIQQTLLLKPDRIAFYSFALVPWIKPGQRLFKDSDLPTSEEKRRLYEIGHQLLTEAGYKMIGMDHFALESDNLYKASLKGELHRNFMGYTDQKTDILLGLGVSSISESPTVFHQNEKLLPKYEEKIKAQQLPTHRGHVLSLRDMAMRKKVLQTMTQFCCELHHKHETENDISTWKKRLNGFIQENLVTLEEIDATHERLHVTDLGKVFLRNITSVFDDYLQSQRDNETRVNEQNESDQTMSSQNEMTGLVQTDKKAQGKQQFSKSI